MENMINNSGEEECIHFLGCIRDCRSYSHALFYVQLSTNFLTAYNSPAPELIIVLQLCPSRLSSLFYPSP